MSDDTAATSGGRDARVASAGQVAARRWFEDFAAGEIDRFGRYEVTREEVLDFAAKYDAQPFHLDDAAAAANPIFGALPASGWHTCGMTMAMIVEHQKPWQAAVLGGAGVDELRWLKPVFPGDTLSCEVEVLETRASQSRPIGTLRLRTTSFNQHGEPVMRFVSQVLMRRRPA